MRETFETPGQVVLELRMPDGSIDVGTYATTETIVDLSGADDDVLRELARIDMRDEGDRYVVTVEVDDPRPGFRFRRGGIRLEIRAPHGAEVQIKTGSADARGRGSFSTISVQSGSGDVDFETVEGDAVVKSSSGDVTVREVGGEAVISTASGDIVVEEVGGAAELRSASGDVHVFEAASGLTAQTASGDLEIDSVAAGTVTMQSASGDMTVGIRRGSRVWVDARSMSGETSSEFELGDEPFGDEEGPLVELRATAMSGDIHIKRA